MRDVDDFGPRRNGLLVCAHDLLIVFDGEIKADLVVDDAFAHHPLPPGLNHVGVILFGADHLVAGLEVEAVDDGVESLSRVAIDGDLFSRAASELGEFLAQRFAALVEDLPHVVGRALVGELVEALHRLLHHDGRWRNAPVVEVDDIWIDRVGALNHRPEIFLGCGFFRAETIKRSRSGEELSGVSLVEKAVD